MINYCESTKSGISYFPPPFVSFQKVENHEEIKKQLTPLIEDHLKKNSDNIKNEWACDVISSFHFGENDFLFENKLLIQAIWNAYNSCIDGLTYDNWITENNDLRAAMLVDMWYNVYEPGGNQEIHTHKPFEFSGIYILDDTEINNTLFWYEANMFPSGLNSYMSSNNPSYDDTAFGEVGEGYIVIFPGSLPHYVPGVKNKKTSISFNFECIDTCNTHGGDE